jgi:Flp pilus assembly protein TadG
VNSKLKIETAMRVGAQRPTSRGQSTVEFALVLVILLALLYGILEVSRMVFINSDLGNAAGEAAQYISLHATDVDVVTKATAEARSKITWADPSQVTVSIPAFTPCSFCKASVTVSYNWQSLINFVPDMQHFTLTPLGPVNLNSTSTVLIVNGSN